ncbi:MAG: hypothetical protein SOV35_06535 [Clostridium sp.]|nr:hypothetical protein [Clostridium sp.]
MKKIINILTNIAAWITCIMIICTFLTSYQFLYVDMIFNSYLPIQVSLSVTMALLAIRFLLFEKGKRRLLYFLFSALFCFIIIYSIYYVK